MKPILNAGSRRCAPLLLLLACGALYGAELINRPPGFRDSPALDSTWRMTVHNAFWDGSTSNDAAASGPKQHIADDFYIDRARGAEFDLHSDATYKFTVYHTSRPDYSHCRVFTSCLDILRAFHFGNPQHDVFMLHLEAKETDLFLRLFDPSGPTPQDLDAQLTTKLKDDNGKSWIFTPNDYLNWCAQRWPTVFPDPATRPDFASYVGENLKTATTACGWPTMDELRGRFMITLHGNFNNNEIDVDQYSHSYGRGIRDVQAFPMTSFIGRGKAQDCGLSGVCNWSDHSVWGDIGTTDPAQYQGPPIGNNTTQFLAQFRVQVHGLVRTESESAADFFSDILNFKDIPSYGTLPAFGFHDLSTDAPRLNILSNFTPYNTGAYSAGCLFNWTTVYTTDPTISPYVGNCQPRNLTEPNSSIEVHALGNEAQGLGPNVTSDSLIFLKKDLIAAAPGDFRAFISTRTDRHQGQFQEENYGPSHTARWSCLMAREDLTPQSPFFAICRFRHRLSWDSSEDGIYALSRVHAGEATQYVYFDTTANDDGAGPSELDAYVQLKHDATGRGFSALKRVTDDPAAQPIFMLASIFDRPLRYIGIATDGGSSTAGGPTSEERTGYTMFSNVRYNGTYQSIATLDYNNIGMPSDADVIDRSYLEGLCGTTLDGLVEFTPGGFSRVGFTTYYGQLITLRNTSGQPIQGPVNVLVSGLTSGVTLVNPAGTAACQEPVSPYVNVPLGPSGVWMPGQTISTTATFSNPKNQQIRYGAQAKAGRP